jgi:hypothetical protein
LRSLLAAGTLPRHMSAGSFTNSENLSGDGKKVPPRRPQHLASLAPHSLVKPPAPASASVAFEVNMSRAANRDYETREIVAARIDSCIDSLLRNDTKLLSLNVHERTVTQQLATYMQGKFPGWQVDCDYSRLGDEVKRLRLRDGIVPVVSNIVARVRDSEENLLVIEAKKDDVPRVEDGDYERLEAFKDQLGYKYAIFLKLVTGKTPGIEVIWI